MPRCRNLSHLFRFRARSSSFQLISFVFTLTFRRPLSTMNVIWEFLHEFSMEFAITGVVIVLPVVVTFIILTGKNYIAERNKRWWKHNVIYHIYPRSFQDSSGDGNGDLRGIIARLDYFDFLGVQILYLGPIFASPMVDNGYDISDFKNINPMFGNMNDFEALLVAVHSRGMKLMLDFVPNHTSDQHQWFLESRRSRTSPKRNWYIWRDPSKDGGPPNNWVSVFGGSAWSLDPKTEQYYLHLFYKEQPDLNFRNPEVRAAMKDVLGFWLMKGVDGFRIDAVPHLLKDKGFKNEPTFPDYDPENLRHKDLDHKFTYNLEGVHEIVRAWRQLCDNFNNPYRLLIGEIFSASDVAMRYYGNHGPEFDFPFNFTLLGLEKGISAYDVHQKVQDYMAALPKGKWPNWLLSNHDVIRIGTRIGVTYIPATTVLYLTLPGTAIMYYGDELGLVDGDIPEKEMKDFRDPCRTPMQWSGCKNAGFTRRKNPWLPFIGNNHKEKNVELQKVNPTSVLSLTEKILKLRNSEVAFQNLNFRVVHVDADVFAYVRFHRMSTFLVAMNFGSRIWCSGLEGAQGFGTVVIDSSTIKEEGSLVDLKRMILHPGQALIAKLKL